MPLERGTPARASELLPIELSLAVETALGRLSEEQREAVLLKVYQGFKFEEMAELRPDTRLCIRSGCHVVHFDNPKVFVGYADPTVIHFGCLKAGLATLHGPTVMSGFAENAGMSPLSLISFHRAAFAS